jgi:hypothetical protein
VAEDVKGRRNVCGTARADRSMLVVCAWGEGVGLQLVTGALSHLTPAAPGRPAASSGRRAPWTLLAGCGHAAMAAAAG